MTLHARSKSNSTRRKRSSNKLHRARTLELLEGRVLLAADTGAAVAPWHNQFNPKDVNHDYRVTPRDALIVINDLMTNGARAVPSSAVTPLVGTSAASNTSYLDVNGDNRVTPTDALRVINALLANKLVQVEAVITDLDGNSITSIAQGEDFKVALFSKDLNDPATPQGGLASGYFDLMYDSPLAMIGTQSPDGGNRFQVLAGNIDASTPGYVPGFIAFSSTPSPTPTAPEELWSLVVHANAAGVAHFLPSFDAVDGHEVVLWGNISFVLQDADIQFISDSITILGPSSISVADSSVFEGNAGQTAMVFEVSVSSDPTQAVTVNYTTLDGSATTANSDYVGASGTLTFLPGGALTQLVTVQINGDTTPEADETFSLLLSNPVNGELADGTAIGTIKNDDIVPTLAVTSVTKGEGNSGNTPFVFTASLTAASAQPVVIVYNTADGTATTADNDYVAASGTLTFAPGETSKSFTISVVGDNVTEPDETFSLTVTPTAGTLTSPDPISVLGTILNDEGLQAIIRLQLADLGGNPLPLGATLPQNGEFILQAYVRDIREVPQGVFQAYVDTLYNQNLVMVNGPINHGSTFVLLPQGGTATPGLLDEVGGVDDGAQPPAGQRGDEQLLFSVPFKAIGTGIANFTLDPADLEDNDVLVYLDDVDPAETHFVDTSIAIGANVFSIDSVTTPEGNSGTTAQVFTVTRFLPTNAQATVVFNTVDGTATTANNDYAGQSGTLTFTAGQTTRTITVNVIGDTTSENNETYSVVLSNAIGAGLSVTTGIGTINNDDNLPTLSINNVNGNEGQSFSFVVTLSAPSGLAVTVPFSTLAVSATAGQDYTAKSGTLTFTPGVVQQTVVVQTLGDATLEPSETFQVALGTPVNATINAGTGTGTIADLPPQVLLVLEGFSGNEGNAGTTNFVFVASLSGATTVPVVVTYATADGTATVVNNDYIAQSGTLTFAPGETSKSITVLVVGGLLVEPNETFSVNLTRTSGPTTNASASAVGTIKNDDGTPTLNINDVTVVPGAAGITNAVFIVSLSPSATENVTVGYSTVDVTAEAGVDYLPQSGNLTFTPGGSLSQFITVPVLGSLTPSADETFEINLSGQSANAVIGDSRGKGTIVRQGFTTSSINIIEGNAGTSAAVFTVNLSQVPPQTVTVVYNTSDGTATAGEDYVAQSGTLTFLAGETTKTISITINGDTTVEPNETFFLNLTGSTGAAVLTPLATATIVNDDGKRATVRLQLADINGVPLPPGDSLDINEQFTLQVYVQDIQSPARGVFQAYIDAFYDANLIEAVGPIVYGSDFGFAQLGSLATPGVIDEAGGLDDGNPPQPPVGEQLLYSVRLRATDLGQAIFTANGADTNELDVLVYTVDEPVPEDAINFIGTSINIGENVFTVSPAEVAEGDSGQTNMVFTVTRFLADNTVATVVFTTSSGTATAGDDYLPQSGTLTFVGNITSSQTVTIPVLGDTTDEPNETFQLVLSNAVNATSSQSPGIGTILDDDGPVSVSIADAIGNEGQDITFLVTLSASSGQTVTVTYNTAAALSGNLATAGVDYETTSGTVTFLPGVTQQSVTVEAFGDIALESSEVFRVLLGTASNAVVSDGSAQGTILDVPPALISGFVFVDLDKDGIKDSNETGIANVIITATPNGGGPSQSTLSNADGTYALLGLIPGTYTLTETQPGFYADGRDKHLGVETPTNDKYTGIVLGPSQAATDYNFGENGVRPDFVTAFINRRAFFASAIVTGQWGPQIATGGTVNPKTGDVWVSFDGGWDGQRIIDAAFNSAQGSATMALYNNSLVKVADSFPTATGAQIIYNGVSGAPYFLKISGTNPSVALTFYDPTVVPLAATSGSTGGSSGGSSLAAGRFASAANSEPSATPATSPSANDLVWQEDDDWVADSLLS